MYGETKTKKSTFRKTLLRNIVVDENFIDTL